MSPKIAVLLENIRSAYNVGSIIRTADSAAIDLLVLSGYTPIPPHPKLGKTALGASKDIKWLHICDPIQATKELKQQNYQIVACEPGEDVDNIYDIRLSTNTCLVFGHEEAGISASLLDLADQRVQLPQLGHKSSLNVAVAAGACIYEVRRQMIFSS